MSLDIRKVKVSKSETSIEWVTREGVSQQTEHEHRLKSTELAAPSFYTALARFIPPVLRLLELPPAYGEGLQVSGVTFVVQDNGTHGLVVTCLKTLADTNSPLVLNTPYLPEDAEGEAPILPTAMVAAAKQLEQEAQAFITGTRAQGDLFAGDKAAQKVRDAVERLRPKKDSGITSVEITDGKGRGIRLMPTTTERI